MKPRIQTPFAAISLKKCFQPNSLSAAAFCATILSFTAPLHAATVVWDGNATGNTVLNDPLNWNPDATPLVTGDTAQWNNTVTGPLSLVYTTLNTNFAGAAGNAGINLELTAAQTSSLSIDSGANTSAIRVNNITIAAGAGAFSLGNSADALNLTLGGAGAQTHIWTNDSTNVATINSDTNFGLGGAGIHTLQLAGAGNWLVNRTLAPLSASLNLLKTGAGTATLTNGGTLTGNNTNSYLPGSNLGPFVVREGTLLMTAGTLGITGEAVIGGVVANGGGGQNAKIQVDGGAVTISTYLSVGRGNGIGTVSSDLVLNNAATLSAVNFSGGYNGGTATNLPKGSVTLNNTSAFTIPTGGIFNLAESAGSNMTVTLNNSAVLNTLGAGGKYIGNAGTGVLTLNGSSTAAFGTGPTTGAVGVMIGNLAGNGTLNLNDTSTASFAGQLYAGYRSGTGTVNMTGGTLSTVGDFRVGGSDTNNGAAENATGTVSISGGTANLSSLTVARGNNNVAVTSGSVTVSGGTLNTANDVILGFAGAANLGKLTISGTGTVNVGTGGAKWLQVDVYDTSKGQIDISGGALNLLNGSSIKAFSGNNGTSGSSLINQTGGTVTFYSDAGVTVGGGGNVDIAYAGSATSVSTYNLDGGTLITPAVVASNTAGTRIFNFNGGTLKAAANNATLLNLNANSATIHANVRNGGAKIDTNGNNVTVSQALLHSDVSGDLATDGGFVKTGGGNLTVSGANTYTGATLVSGGTLTLSGSGTLDTTPSITVNGAGAKFVQANASTLAAPVTITQGGLDGNGTIGSITIANSVSNTLDVGNGAAGSLSSTSLTFQGAATVTTTVTSGSVDRTFYTDHLTTNAAGKVVINATNSSGVWLAGEYPFINYVTHTGSAANFIVGTIPGLSSNQTASIITSGSTIALKISGDSLTWTGKQSTAWTTAAIGGTLKNWNYPSTSTTAEYANGNPVLFDDTAARFTVNLTSNVAPSATVFDNSNDYLVTTTGGFGITSGSLTKNNTGKVTLATVNTYTGATTINDGTLQLGDGTTDGSITTSSAINVNNYSSLIFNIVGNQTYANPITGPSTSSLSKQGAGTLTLSGNNTFAGNFTLESGILNINSPNALGVAPGTFTVNSGTLNNTSGATVTSTGAKLQAWNTDITFTGTNDLYLGTGAVTLGGAGTSRTVTVSAGNFGTGPVSGAYDVIKAGTGAWRLNGNPSVITGALNIQAGIVGAGGDFTASALTGTGILENGSANTKWTFWNIDSDQTSSTTIRDGSGGGLLGIVKNGAATWTLTNNANSATANLTVNSGKLVLNNTGTYGAGTGAGVLATNLTAIIGNNAAANGILEINGATVNYNNLSNADGLIYRSTLSVGNSATGAGALHLSSGSLTTYRQLALGAVGGSFGGYTQTGGTTNVSGFLALGLGTANGVLNQTGGTFTMTTTPVTSGAGAGSTGLMNIGGSAVFNLNGTVDNGLWVGENGAGILNVSGTAAINFAATNNGLEVGRGTTGSGIINLLGGNVTTPKVYKGTGTGTLNFNGGTLTANAASTTFLTGLTSTYVRSGGGTVGNGGNNITITQPLLAPTGNGVSATGLTVSGSGFIDTPIVQITGDGTGATAVATIDAAGNLTGITITNRGNDYTTPPTFTLVGGGIGNSGAITGTATLVASTGNGAMAFTGAGITTLGGVNTYKGNTTINSGTVVSFAAGSSLRIVPTTNGLTNKVTGAGTGAFYGDLAIDTTGATIADGNSWTVVDVTSKTYDPITFNVPGFTQSSDVWTKVDGANTWKFTEATGILTLQVAGGGGYSAWAAANANGEASNGDYDKDGVQNGVEYFMGATGSTFTANPAIIGGAVTWPKSATFSGTYLVQVSTDLATWTTATTGVVDNGSSVVYTLPTGLGKDFVRLVVKPN